jgi:acyl dehydratase
VPINVEAMLAAELPHDDAVWNEDAVILYHLGLGAGAAFTDPRELEYTFEAKLKVLPSFAVVPVFATMRHVFSIPGVEVNRLAVVHGEHEIVIHRPLPRAAEVRTRTRISNVFDRGTGAVVEIENTTTATGETAPLFTNIWSLFVRGEGGFGGASGPKSDVTAPTRAPDAQVALPILPQQHLIYRLSGDKTLFHVDPEIARQAGFEKPIMHGLCSYGMVCKALVDSLLESDVTRVARFRARFARPVFPGETILVSAWREGGRIVATTQTKERGTPVVTNCWMDVAD